MKNLHLIIAVFFIVINFGCKNNKDEAADSVEKYLKTNLRDYASYTPISFSEIDTLTEPDTIDGKIGRYLIEHVYYIVNKDKDKVKAKINFYLDEKFSVINTGFNKNINGDYGEITGNVFWKYNNYVGNKPDVGSNVVLFPTDTSITKNIYEATCDVMGNFKIEKIPSGRYFMIVTSKNTTDSPISHIQKLIIYKDYIKDILGFDLDTFKNELSEIQNLDSLYSMNINDFDSNWSLDRMQQNMNISKKLENELMKKSEKLINSFPKDFTSKIKLYSPYSYSYDFTSVYIEGNKTVNEVIDFGTTYM